MESEWKWDRLDLLERKVAELLLQGRSNAAICNEVYLWEPRISSVSAEG